MFHELIPADLSPNIHPAIGKVAPCCAPIWSSSMGLTERDSHCEFGENWSNYAKTIDRNRIDSAVAGLKKLFPEGLAGKTFLDIGCGSGVHSLAALSLGASSVLATDIDENSVSTTRQILSRRFPDERWAAKGISVFRGRQDQQ